MQGSDAPRRREFNRQLMSPASHTIMNLTGRRILIVEDDAMIRELVRIWLRPSGAEIFTAANGLEALHACSSMMFDVILCDLMMPVLGGREFLQQYVDPIPGRRPVLVMTALGKDALEALPTKYLFGVLRKPFELEALLRMVESCSMQTPLSVMPAATLPIKETAQPTPVATIGADVVLPAEAPAGDVRKG